MTFHDVAAFGVRDIVGVLQPYLVGRICVQSTRDVRDLLRVLLMLGLVYSLLVLFELRFSPNLHRWIYGYHAREDFSQTLRWGGYRPTVFMEHGLAVALFAMAVALAAVIYGHLRKGYWGLPSWCWTLYFTFILIMCRSVGALALGLIALVAAAWMSPRFQLRLAVAVAAICLVYPVLRITRTFPVDGMLRATAVVVSPERAESLKTRFDNEEILVDHVRQRLWFGWGGYGRNRVIDARGDNAVITDGHWIILLSVGGIGLLYSLFGMMLASVFMARRVLRSLGDGIDRQVVAGLALLTACYVFDLIPNGMFNQAPFFLGGALASLVAAHRLGRCTEEELASYSASWVLLKPTPSTMRAKWRT
jgi:hypothetical protein